MNNDILSVIVYYYILLQRSHINLKDGLKVGFLSPRNSLLTYIHTILVSNSSLPVSYCETKIESSYVLRQSHILRKRMPSMITKNHIFIILTLSYFLVPPSIASRGTAVNQRFLKLRQPASLLAQSALKICVLCLTPARITCAIKSQD